MSPSHTRPIPKRGGRRPPGADRSLALVAPPANAPAPADLFKIATKLSRLGYWEFEDYDDAGGDGRDEHR